MRKHIIILFLVTVYFVCLSTTCDLPDDRPAFSIQNNCGEDIHVYFGQIPPEQKTITPYDALLLQDDSNIYIPYGLPTTGIEYRIIPKGEKREIKYSLMDLEEGCNLQFLIFKESTMKKHTKKELMENCIYDKLYILSYKDIKQLNNSIEYINE